MKKIVAFILAVVLMTTVFTSGINADNSNVKIGVKVEANKLEKIEKDCAIIIRYPVLSGFNCASKLNDMIQNHNTNSIGFIRNAYFSLQEMKEEQKAVGEEISKLGVSLETTFDYSLNGNLLSVMSNDYTYTGGAHELYSINSFTVNTKTDEIYTFNSLFNQNSNYKKVILNKLNTMIDKEKELYFGDAKQTVAKRNYEFQFYIDGNNLIIYFGLYDLRPYAGGMSKFSISAKDLKSVLKDEVYSQMINAKPLSTLRLNGTSVIAPYKAIVKNFETMVPLKYLAETLGYKVDWDSKKGASVADGYIKNNTTLYYTEKTKKTPIKLTAAKIINNSLYVPVDYFSQVLNEDTSFDGEVVRFFKFAEKEESSFNRQILEFRFPTSAQEGAEMYAKAVKERKGAIEYALYSEKLRAETKTNFEDLNWVTGVSSPWVTGYDIKNTGKGTYDIVFHYATSAGKERDSTTKITVEAIANQEFWQITDVQE